MSKRSLIFIAAGLICLATLVFISLPIKQVKEQIPFQLADGATGEIILVAPAYLRLEDWAEVLMEVKFNSDHLSGESVKVKGSLQSATIAVKPAGEVTAVIPVGGQGPFKWQVRTNQTGEQIATAWCFREDPTGHTLILAKEIPFVVKSVFGVRFYLVRWLLGGLSILFLVLVFLSTSRNKNRIQ